MADNFDRFNSCEFSSVVNVREFKKTMQEAVDSEDLDRKRTGMDQDKVVSEMEIIEETLTELDEVCSPSNLKCPAEPESKDGYIDMLQCSKDIDLTTLSVMCVDKLGVNPFQEQNYITLSEKLKEKKIKPGSKPIDGVEIVLSVAFYHPTMLKRAQEFWCIGRQKLTELRDIVCCAADSIVPGEHSEQPELSRTANAKDFCPSGFFFIEGVFYNDTRDDSCRDYSKEIIDWVNKEERHKLPNLGIYTTQKMEETTFGDLNIRLGYPYIYYHQGSCEHLMIFRDLRMLHCDDAQYKSQYPLQIFRHRPHRQKCGVCYIYSARWLTRNDALMSEDPSFFCDKCFNALHYKDGQKLYMFEAYHYAGEQFW